MSIAHTRAMISAILEDRLREIPTAPDPIFGVAVPVACPGVPSDVLQPRNTWADGAAYDAQASDLARRFTENFKQFAAQVSPEVAAAGPRG
jgi:phosphoenolpyruvate carboxykinase (ATP)